MISLDAIRTAALSDRPWDRLDELVRAEMSTGRKVAEIADDFIKVVDAVWETPGLSEDGHDAFGDALDALTGNCSSESCYQDPPNNTLPTEEEIASLPRWARVAFAARCARRVLPLYAELHPYPEERDSGLKAVRLAVEVAETSADTAVPSPVAAEAAANAAAFNRPAIPAAGTPGTHNAPAAGFAAETAADAAFAAAEAARTRVDADARSTVAVATAVRCAADAAAYAVANIARTEEFPVTLLLEFRSDFDTLLSAAFGWNDSTPASASVFGPLWPEGPPPGWPADTNVQDRAELPLALLAVDRGSPTRIVDEVVNLFNAFSHYYVQRTGVRLTLEGDVYTQLSALVGAGV